MVAIATSYISSFEGFDQPWTQLACLVPDLEVRELSFGSGFLASGTRKTDGDLARPEARPASGREWIDSADAGTTVRRWPHG